MSTFILVLIVIVAILLVLVVLAQNPKGGGLASGFGGSGATQFMGVKKTGDFLESSTWVLAILLLSLSLTANVLVSDPVEADEESDLNIENTKGANANAPAAPSENAEGSSDELAPADSGK